MGGRNPETSPFKKDFCHPLLQVILSKKADFITELKQKQKISFLSVVTQKIDTTLKIKNN